MAAEVSAKGPCGVAVERIRTGAPALMDASFQQAIEAASAAFAGGKSLVRTPKCAVTMPKFCHDDAGGHAVRAVDRRHQSSLDREYS